jgi:hypothetical protein
MPLIDLARIEYKGTNRSSDFYVGAVVNSSSGPKEVKVISNEIDLDTYFPNLEYREGYVKLLKAGANLALKRINNEGTRLSTLRLTNNPNLRYVYPKVYDSIEYEPTLETDFYSGILIDSLNPNNTLDPLDLYPGSEVTISGIIYGSYNVGDTIKAKINNVLYITQLDQEGKFTLVLNGVDFKEDEYSRLEVTLVTLNGIDLTEVKTHLDYSLSGYENIFVDLDQIELIDNNSLPAGVTTYEVRGVISGDFKDNDLVELIINGNSYFTNCDYRGEFIGVLSLSDVLQSNKIEVIATTNNSYRPFKAYNYIEYKTDYLDLDLNSTVEHRDAYIEMQTLNTKTLVYNIDFGTSDMFPEDYLIIPRSNPANWNSNVMIYFVSELDSTMTPDDFVNPVPISSVSSPQWKLIIPDDHEAKELLRSNRAKYIYDLFTGAISGMDSGVIKNLCTLDEINNRVTLVFSTPVSDIKYYQSNDPSTPFSVTSDEERTNELLVQFSRLDSVISFKTLIEGSLEIKLKLTHIDGYKFYLEETYKDSSNTYLISLYASDKDYNGENIFVEDIINYTSTFIRSVVHINNSIESYLSTGVGFSPLDAKGLEGEYLVSKGLEGVNNISDLGTYESSIDALFESDMDLNLFLTDVFNEKEYLEKLQPKLESHQVMAMTNIPDSVLEGISSDGEFSDRIDLFMLPDSKREFLIYCFGESLLNDLHYIPSSFYQARELIAGNFVGSIKDNIISSYLSDSERSILDKKYINYLEETDSTYNITYISNLPIYLEPIYLLTSIYAKQYLTRFMRSKIGEFGLDVYFEVKQEIANIVTYTSLISKLKIDKFYIEGNKLEVIFLLELTGLVGKTLSINISLNIN